MLFKETVTPQLLETARKLCAVPELASFRMAGGTAIALQLGHRKSVDIDLFSNQKTNKASLRKILANQFKETVFFVSPDRIQAEISGLKVELYDHWLMPFKTPAVEAEGLRLASLTDLTAFKLSAITGRREKKDYIDLYFLFSALGINQLLAQFKEYDPLLSPKSLIFALSEVKAAQANQSVMPDMLKEVSWTDITATMIKASKVYLTMFREENP
ncbi:MAG: nucleotidyl transferase AbiEii/AbiGii toxin family protein [Flammeovirgaceae bacterium]|nr:MAG: nucleotidyl transferase AbiEii/AbiGii toxin family protein [Flammeovirgaceae bacterium]